MVCRNSECKYCTAVPCGACGNCLHPDRKNKCTKRYIHDVFCISCSRLSKFCKNLSDFYTSDTYIIINHYLIILLLLLFFLRICPSLNLHNKTPVVKGDRIKPSVACLQCGVLLVNKHVLKRHVGILSFIEK